MLRLRVFPGFDMINWSIGIMRIAGVTVRIHLMLALVVLGTVASDFVYLSASAGVGSLVFYSVLFLSVLLHEFGHCFAAFKFGGTPRLVVIWLLGGVSHIENPPQRPLHQLIISAAGPAVNLFIAAVLLIVLGATGSAPAFGFDFQGSSFWAGLARQAFLANSLLFAFNMLPALPMDGGNVLLWFLADRIGFISATRATAIMGQGLAVLIGVACLVFRSQMPFIVFLFTVLTAVFIFIECERQKRLADELEEENPGEWMEDEFDFMPNQPERIEKPSFLERLRARRIARKHEMEEKAEIDMREKVDELLEKISMKGISALSEKEKTFLREASKKFGEKSGLSSEE